MLHTIAEAAKATGLEESIIFRAIEDGQIHGTRNVSGEWHVEDAELHSTSTLTLGQPQKSQTRAGKYVRACPHAQRVGMRSLEKL
jgi:hypothetical protein